MQPEHSAQAECEPASEKGSLLLLLMYERWPMSLRIEYTYNQAEKVTEDRNSFGDDPGKDPQTRGNTDPGADGDPVTLMHAVSTTEDTDIDVFEGDVAVDDTSDDDLDLLVILFGLLEL